MQPEINSSSPTSTLSGSPLMKEINSLHAMHIQPLLNTIPVSLKDKIEAAIAQASQNHSSGAFLMVRITNLAMIMNGYGHDVAEQVVLDIQSRIQMVLSPSDLIERTSRDEFSVIVCSITPEDVERLSVRITNVVLNYGRDNYATTALHVLAVVSSISFPEEASNAEEVTDRSYTALHSNSDQLHRPYSIARAEADYSRQQMGLASYLHSAFREDRLRLAWQPIVSVAEHKVAHYEALLRIRGANGRISSAGPLIPVAEKMGLIGDIDAMVMELVVKELRDNPNVHMAFNVSNVTTENHAWLERLSHLVEETPEIASRMMVEITETAVQRDLRKVAYFVAHLQSMGAVVALDDFGSGYTSFRQLKALTIDLVKIDGVFIKDIATNADSRFFVKTLLDFARGFGLKTVAEFVENGEIAKILIDMGVDYLQGYYLGKPETRRLWLNEGEFSAE